MRSVCVLQAGVCVLSQCDIIDFAHRVAFLLHGKERLALVFRVLPLPDPPVEGILEIDLPMH